MDSNNHFNSMPFLRYFPRSIKFYGVKNDKLAAFLFIIILCVNFCSNLFIQNTVKNIELSNIAVTDVYGAIQYLLTMLRLLAFSFGNFILMSILSSYYIYAYIRDLRGIPYSFSQCIGDVSKRIFKVLVAYLIISLAVIMGSIFIIPGIILYVMLIFTNQFIVDQDRGIFDSLKASLNLTNGFKFNIFISILILNIIIFLFPTFVETTNGPLVFSFVSAFISTIFSIIYQRFLTLMYFDLEYIRKSRKININV